MRLIANLAFGFSALGLLLGASARAEALSIRIFPPDVYKTISGDRKWDVILDGEIDSGAPGRLAVALKKIGGDGADVYINSPGGSLAAGMEIGRILRNVQANTYIGTLVSDPTRKFGNAIGTKFVPGACYSSCALVFLGGVYRYGNQKSKYGVHRFWTQAAPSKDDLDYAQIVSAAITSYIREMGVNPGLFDLMVKAGKDTIRILTESELSNLNVVNNGRKPPEWTIEAVEGGQYLRGSQDSVYGKGKAVFFCKGESIGFYSFYDAGEARATEVVKGGWHHSILVNGKSSPLKAPSELRATQGEISAFFPLTREQVVSLASSSSIGHAMQLSPEAPTFVGYEIDIPASASSRVRTYLRNCVPQ